MIAKIVVICGLVAIAQGVAISVVDGGLGLGLGGHGVLGTTNYLDGHGLLGTTSILGGHGLLGGQGLLGGHGLLGTSILGGHGVAVARQPVVDVHAPAHYEFKYGVQDAHTGDNKQHSESRVGDTVKGEYSLAEPDGTIRIVKYTADPHNGFNAVVSRVGHAAHPQVVHKSVVTSPVLSHGLGLDLGIGLH